VRTRGPACLWSRVFKARIVGIDISARHVSEAQPAALRHGCSNLVNFVVADGRTFDSGGMLFDAAIALDSIVYMDPVDVLFNNLRRLLRPSGTVLLASECIDSHAPPQLVQEREKTGAVKCITQEELESALRRNGFKIESVSRDFERRERFAEASLLWMNCHNQHAGRESMKAILHACQSGGAFEVLVLSKIR
jgi:cyclopropane fatty-acyl-phospholipid synthase-like methyltransferase